MSKPKGMSDLNKLRKDETPATKKTVSITEIFKDGFKRKDTVEIKERKETK